MILSDKNISRLKELGLNLLPTRDVLIFSPSEKDPKKSSLHFPRLDLKRENSKFTLIHWEWAPGPGPGDFALDIENEEEVVKFIESYYFGTNPYREKLNTYLNNHRSSYNFQELESIFQKLMEVVKNEFGEQDIELNERGTYYKIHNENWNITKPEPENPTVIATWGILSHELGIVRDKISTAEDFEPKDIEKISSLLMDLSINLMKRNCS